MVQAVLVRILIGKLANRVVEGFARTHVACDHRGVSRSRVCTRERPTTYPPVGSQVTGIEIFDKRTDLRVAELPDIAIATITPTCPSQEYVTRRLHETLTGHDPLAVVFVQALSRIWLQYRGACLLNLQEQWVIIPSHEKADGANGADAADPDDFERQVAKAITVEQHPNMFGQRLSIARDRLPISGLESRCLCFGGMEDQRRLVLDSRGRAGS